LGTVFLFAFHINYGSILYHFPHKRDTDRKSRFFHTPLHWTPSLGVSVGISPSRYK